MRKADLGSLAGEVGEWLRGAGTDPDIVISTRIRLARNLASTPFPGQAKPADRERIDAIVCERIATSGLVADGAFVSLAEVSELDRRLLVERHLISKEHASGEGCRSVAFDSAEGVSIMVNEEDHLRIQVIRSGMELEGCWSETDRIEHTLGGLLEFAYDSQLGYLTSCPTNVGTGMRVSIMLHLPALVLTDQMEKVFESMSHIKLAVRGLYGEGTSASGDFYQISNQVTLGRDERQLLTRLQQVIPRVIEYERLTRDALRRDEPNKLEDRIWRALGTLKTARRITSEEMMEHLSSVRMGVNLGILPDVALPTINQLFVLTQPAHLQKLEQRKLSADERNVARARFIREKLGDL